MRADEWPDPSLVSPRALLADRCAQIYCGLARGVESGPVGGVGGGGEMLLDKLGRPFMVGQIQVCSIMPRHAHSAIDSGGDAPPPPPPARSSS